MSLRSLSLSSCSGSDDGSLQEVPSVDFGSMHGKIRRTRTTHIPEHRKQWKKHENLLEKKNNED